MSALDKDSATGLDHAGVLWILLFANSELRIHSDFLVLELFAMFIRKLAAGEFSSDIRNLISATN